MRTAKLSVLFVLCVCVLLISGCGDQLQDLRIKNNTQRKHIAELESQVQVTRLELDQMKRKFATVDKTNDIEIDTLNQKIAALKEDIEKKKTLIARMQQQLFYGTLIPVELSTVLEDFANSQDMVTYDPNRGIVRFKSDLLFEKGSDKVTSKATKAIKLLCKILNTKQAERFDVIVTGHTDDIPISKPATRVKHPTNRHLSSHRAISVVRLMQSNNIAARRISTRGFGEYRPVSKNKSNKKGNPKNRRVEIYIVGKGL